MPQGYKKVQILDFQGLARDPWPSSVPLQDLLAQIGQPEGVIVKMRVERAIKIRGDLHLKEEFFRGLRSWFLLVKSLWGRSRLRRQWEVSLVARERGIPTPEPLAYLEKRRSLLLSKSLLVTQYQPSFATLTEYLRGKLKEGETFQQGSAFLESLAKAVRKMHEQGMVHSDLKGSNILVKEEEGTWNFQVTDLKAARFLGPERPKPGMPLRGRERDILRLLASLRPLFDSSERALFLQHYLLVEGERAQPMIARWESESRRRFPSFQRKR